MHRERIATLACGPEVARDHGHAASHRRLEGDHSLNALHRFRLRGVEARDLRANALRIRHNRGEHAGQLHVLRVDRGAVGLRPGIDAMLGFADETEVFWILQLHFFRHGQLCGIGDELAEARRAARGSVTDAPSGYRQLARGHLPALRGRAHQHCPRDGARLTHLIE